MNTRSYFAAAVAAVLPVIFTGAVHAQVVAGLDPLDGAGGPDGWTNMLIVNLDTPFDFGAQDSGVLTYTNFWAAPGRTSVGGGYYTPFVAELLDDDPLIGDDFVVRAIGTTREAGVDFTCDGEFQFPFHDTDTFTVQDGWVAGFLSSDPLGEATNARSPIPFGGSGLFGWGTGTSAPGQGAPAIEIGEPILEGLNGTTDAWGGRIYQFNSSAVAGDTKPALDPGGRVGEACEAPPEPIEGQIGAPLPLVDGTPDGWSGIPVLYGFSLPPGETVDVVRYYAADGREFDVEDELYNVTPIIARQEDGSVENGDGIFSVWEVGPNMLPTEIGENEFEWGSMPIPDDGNLYHPAFLQWFQDADDANGGVVAFADNGTGMHYINVDTTDYIPDEDLGEVEEGFDLSPGHSSGPGGRAYQLNFQMSSAGGGEPGDFNNDDVLDELDINDLFVQIRDGGMGAKYDLNDDGLINNTDRDIWVEDLRITWFGDANLDGEFNSGDFVQVFTAGLYDKEEPALWESGDWDGDGFFNSSDFVIAFTDGGYDKGLRVPPAAAVPEPSGLLLLSLGLIFGLVRRGRLPGR